MFHEQKHPTADTDLLRSKRKTESLAAIRSADMEDRGTKRALLSLTGRYCTSQFLSIERRDKHAETEDHCQFPTGMTAKDKLVQLASSAGGMLELGTRPNRLDGITSHSVVASEDGAAGERAANCFQRFNRKEGVPPYRKPAKLVQVLRELFDARPKLDEKQMWDRMKKMRDTDGSLMFCYRKRGTPTPAGMKKNSKAWREWPGCHVCSKKPCDCSGLLLTEEQIKAWIGQETQRRNQKAKSTADEET